MGPPSFSSQGEVKNILNLYRGVGKKKNVVHYRQRQIVLQESTATCSRRRNHITGHSAAATLLDGGHPAEFDAPLLSVTLTATLEPLVYRFPLKNSTSLIRFPL
jgi:hypothetical protein